MQCDRSGIEYAPRYLLDTNAIIYALQRQAVLPTGHYEISVITEMELLSYSKITPPEERTIRQLLQSFLIINLDEAIKETAIQLRKNEGLKLPDAIIVSTAVHRQATLVSSDKVLMRVKDCPVITLDELCPDQSKGDAK